jgi:hypothetical protein
LVDLHVNTGAVTGSIKTWEFNYGNGWNPATKYTTEFPHIVNIGPNPPADSADKIIEYFEKENSLYISAEQLIASHPFIFFLLPEEIKDLNYQLLRDGHLKIEYDEFGQIHGIGKIG